MKLLVIVLPGKLPVPTTKGGAVESLVFNLIKENEISRKFKIVIFSPFEKNAYSFSKYFKFTVFHFVKVSYFELLIYKIFRKVFESSLPSELFHYKVPFLIRKLKYDEVVLENRPEAISFYYRILKKKIILHLHNDNLSLIKNSQSFASLTKKVITVSEYISNLLRAKFSNLQISTVYNCSNFTFDLNKQIIERKKLREKFSIEDNQKILFFSGRLVKEKGILELVKSLESVKSNCKLFVAGSSWFGSNEETNFTKELYETAQKIQKGIKFLGYIDNKEVESFYYFADLVIVPSTWEEPGALVVAEALSLGKPLIITKSGGIVEYVKPEGAIILDKNKDLVSSLAKSIDLLLSNEVTLLNMSKVNLFHSKIFSQSNYYRNFTNSVFPNE
jgi:spore coat protein SA